MNPVLLLELAKRWDQDAKEPEMQDGSEKAKIGNAKRQGYRECKRECADTLRTLIEMLGIA